MRIPIHFYNTFIYEYIGQDVETWSLNWMNTKHSYHKLSLQAYTAFLMQFFYGSLVTVSS